MAFLQNGVPIVTTPTSGEPRYNIPADTTSGGWWSYNSSWKTYEHSTYSQGGTSASGFTIPNGVRKICCQINDFRYHENVSDASGAHGQWSFQLLGASGVGHGGAVLNGGEGSYTGVHGNQNPGSSANVAGYFGNGLDTASGNDGSSIPLPFMGKYQPYGVNSVSVMSEAKFHHYTIELTRLSVRSGGSFNNTSASRWYIDMKGWPGYPNSGSNVTFGGVTYNAIQATTTADYKPFVQGYCGAMPGGHVTGLMFRGKYNKAFRFQMGVEVSWEF